MSHFPRLSFLDSSGGSRYYPCKIKILRSSLNHSDSKDLLLEKKKKKQTIEIAMIYTEHGNYEDNKDRKELRRIERIPPANMYHNNWIRKDLPARARKLG